MWKKSLSLTPIFLLLLILGTSFLHPSFASSTQFCNQVAPGQSFYLNSYNTYVYNNPSQTLYTQGCFTVSGTEVYFNGASLGSGAPFWSFGVGGIGGNPIIELPSASQLSFALNPISSKNANLSFDYKAEGTPSSVTVQTSMSMVTTYSNSYYLNKSTWSAVSAEGTVYQNSTGGYLIVSSGNKPSTITFTFGAIGGGGGQTTTTTTTQKTSSLQLANLNVFLKAGTNVTVAVVITNTNLLPIEVSSLSFTSIQRIGFSILTSMPLTIPALQQGTIRVNIQAAPNASNGQRISTASLSYSTGDLSSVSTFLAYVTINGGTATQGLSWIRLLDQWWPLLLLLLAIVFLGFVVIRRKQED